MGTLAGQIIAIFIIYGLVVGITLFIIDTKFVKKKLSSSYDLELTDLNRGNWIKDYFVNE